MTPTRKDMDLSKHRVRRRLKIPKGESSSCFPNYIAIKGYICPLSHAFFPPQVGWLRRVLRCLWVFAVSGWFRRFRPSPLSAGLVPCPSTLRFSFPLPFQGSPAPGQVCWCVFAPSFFFCVPLFASWLSNVHLIFNLISFFIPRSSSSSSHYYAHHPAGGRVCVCVCVHRYNKRF